MGWSAFRKTGLTYHNPNRSVKGYTLFSPMADDSTYLINMAGQIVHRWQFNDFQPDLAMLLPSGHLMVSGRDMQTRERARTATEADYEDLNLHFTRFGGGATTVRQYDFESNLLWSYDNPAMHHDFYVMENDHLLLPIWTVIPEDRAAEVRGGDRRGRKNLPPLVGDDIIEIDRDGHEVWRCHTWQLFDPRRDPIRPLQNRWEWTHLNSIDLTQDGKLIISCRNNSRVAIIDRDTQQIVWKLGEPEISHQHHATSVDKGNIQIFDNGMNRPQSLSYSRVIEVDPSTSKVVWEYTAQPPQQFFSGHIAGAQRLAMGNVLICEGTSGRLFEVTRRGEIVWEWITPFVFGQPDGSLRTWIYRAYRYDVDHPALADRDLDPARYKSLNATLGLLS